MRPVDHGLLLVIQVDDETAEGVSIVDAFDGPALGPGRDLERVAGGSDRGVRGEQIDVFGGSFGESDRDQARSSRKDESFRFRQAEEEV